MEDEKDIVCEGIVLCGFISSSAEYKTTLSAHVPTQGDL